jgi:hypothetical protein
MDVSFERTCNGVVIPLWLNGCLTIYCFSAFVLNICRGSTSAIGPLARALPPPPSSQQLPSRDHEINKTLPSMAMLNENSHRPTKLVLTEYPKQPNGTKVKTTLPIFHHHVKEPRYLTEKPHQKKFNHLLSGCLDYIFIPHWPFSTHYI